MSDPQREAERLYASGYCPVSNRYRMASRIDREDWREYMAAKRVEGFPGDKEENFQQAMRWVEGLAEGAADHYRRLHSRDTIEVSQPVYDALRRLTPGSGWGGVNEYRALICDGG